MPRSRPSSILISPDFIISSSSSVSSLTPAKRIRFAPLPELARDDLVPDITDDPPSDLLTSSCSSSSSSSSPSISFPEKSSPDSSLGSSPIIQQPSLPDHPPSPVISDLAGPKKPSLFLRPFKRFYTSTPPSSSNTLTPTSSIDRPTRKSIKKEESLSLGVVNLFRSTSRESSHSAFTISPWSGGIPLSRTQSNQSNVSKSSSHSRVLSLDSKSKPKPPPLGQQQKNRHKGTLMLNGRVYGAKQNSNPFANARDEEPEFVEWGYGGMGSIKGAKSAGVSSNWDRLHGGMAIASDQNSQISGIAGVSAGIGATDPELDDGSGLAWLKRRREERERKAREQKELQEKQEASESQSNTPTRSSSTLATIHAPISSPPPVNEIPSTQRPPAIDISPLAIVQDDEETATNPTFPTPTHHSEPSSSPNVHEEETSQPQSTHVLRAINVPARLRRPSKGLKESAELSPQIQIAGSPMLVSPSGDDCTGVHASTINPMQTDKPPCPSSSSSESESGSEDDDGEEDDDEDEQNGSSALGNAAGVEKISRHSKE